MPEGEGYRRRYHVHSSRVVVERIRQIQRRAKREGRGEQVLAVIKHIHQRLQQDPHELGEPLYRLDALQLEIRTCIILPLVVDFAVHQGKPVVFIKTVKLMSERR